MDFKKVFEPKRMAVVGVSINDPLNPGQLFLTKIIMK